MEKLSQTRAPIYEALEAFRKQRVVPFDVPGHKRGRGNPELAELLGEKCVPCASSARQSIPWACASATILLKSEQIP